MNNKLLEMQYFVVQVFGVSMVGILLNISVILQYCSVYFNVF